MLVLMNRLKRLLRLRRCSTLIVVLCTVALAMSAFGHRPAVSTHPTGVDLSAYAMPDGSLPVLCLSSGNTEDGNLAPVWCEFCRLAATVTLPEASKITLHFTLSSPIVFFVPEDSGVTRQAWSPHAPPHGPPTSQA